MESTVLKRQKAILAMLDRAGQPLSPIRFVKLLFLLRCEAPFRNDRTYYGFVPYQYGPFSFALYRELAALRRDGYVTRDERSVSLADRTRSAARQKAHELSKSQQEAIERVVAENIAVSQDDLVRSIYRRFPWYASRTELRALAPKDIPQRPRADVAIYTVGYEGKSVDGFFDGLLRSGIHALVDVRANPVSRKYGFAKRSMSEIARKLDIDYHHLPQLGIPSGNRADLSDYASYQQLLAWYESEILPEQPTAIEHAVALIQQKPTAFLCVERDVSCCHRGRLAKHTAAASGLSVVHV